MSIRATIQYMLKRTARLLVAIGVSLAVAATALVATTPAAAAVATTVHTIWVSTDSVTPSTTDDTVGAPADKAAATALVAKLNAYWNAETGGAVTLVLGDFETRQLSGASCSVASLFAKSRLAAFDGKFASQSKWKPNVHLLSFSAEKCDSDMAGQGTVGGTGGLMATGVGAGTLLGVAVAAHEFGHNLGFQHANSTVCPHGVDSGDACATEAYADFLDVMGFAVDNSLPHVSTPQLIELGYPVAFSDLSQTSGIVKQTLSTTGTRAVRITDPATGERYYVEYRTPDAADAASWEFSPVLHCASYTNGLYRCFGGMDPKYGGIRILRADDDGTYVMAVGANNTTHLGSGESFTNHDDAFQVTVTSLSSAGAAISVAFGSSIAPAPVPTVVAPTPEIIEVAPPVTSTQPEPTVATVTPVATPAVAPVGAPAPATKVRTHVKLRLHHTTIKHGKRPILTAIVLGTSRPTGTLTVKINGKKVKTVKVTFSDAGVVKITLAKRTKVGTAAITVTYSGSKKTTASTSVVKKLKVK